jgi:hypothetical protein
MVFLLEITNIWQKSRDFRFLVFEIFLSVGWYGFYYGFLVVLNVLHKFFVSSYYYS